MAAARQHDTSVPDVDVLVGGIRTLLRAQETLRQTGMPADLPPALVDVCRDVVAAHGGPVREARQTPDMAAPASAWRSLHVDRDDAVRDMPLRRLLWQVLEPGTTFTVGEVVAALGALGADVDAAKVSNALGYWVARERLRRERKGLYHFPLGAGADPAPHDHPATRGDFPARGRQDQPDVRDRRPAGTGRGQEDEVGETSPEKEGTRRAS